MNLKLLKSKEPRKPKVPVFKKPVVVTGPTAPLQRPSYKQLVRMEREEQHLPTRLRQMHAKQLNQAEMQNQKLRFQLERVRSRLERAQRRA